MLFSSVSAFHGVAGYQQFNSILVKCREPVFLHVMRCTNLCLAGHFSEIDMEGISVATEMQPPELGLKPISFPLDVGCCIS